MAAVTAPSASSSANSAAAAPVQSHLVGESIRAIGAVDSRSFYVHGDEADPEGAKVTAELRQKNPNVLFVIARSCNLNLVVYEGVVDNKRPTRLHEEMPVDIYWLTLDPKEWHKSRKKKMPHDRCELAWPERKLAYGAKTKPSKSRPGTFALHMNASPNLPIRVGIDPKSGRPRALLELHPKGDKSPGEKGGIPCHLDRI